MGLFDFLKSNKDEEQESIKRAQEDYNFKVKAYNAMAPAQDPHFYPGSEVEISPEIAAHIEEVRKKDVDELRKIVEDRLKEIKKKNKKK